MQIFRRESIKQELQSFIDRLEDFDQMFNVGVLWPLGAHFNHIEPVHEAFNYRNQHCSSAQLLDRECSTSQMRGGPALRTPQLACVHRQG